MFKYQTFDRESLTFSEHPIIPPSPKQMRYFGENTDADEPPKNDDGPAPWPVDTEQPDPVIEIIDTPADAPADGMCTVSSQIAPYRMLNIHRYNIRSAC